MTTSLDLESPVHLKAVAAQNQPAETPELEDLYRGFERELLIPLLAYRWERTDRTWSVGRGDLFVVPSWQPFSAKSQAGASDSGRRALDLFRFSDAPVFEALGLSRTEAAASAGVAAPAPAPAAGEEIAR